MGATIKTGAQGRWCVQVGERAPCISAQARPHSGCSCWWEILGGLRALHREPERDEGSWGGSGKPVPWKPPALGPPRPPLRPPPRLPTLARLRPAAAPLQGNQEQVLESASELSTEMHPQDIQTAEGGKPVEAGDAPAPGFAGGPGGDGKRTLACQPLPAYRAAEGSRFTHGWSTAGARSTYQTQPAKTATPCREDG